MSGVGPLDEENFTPFVAHDCTYRNLRCHVTGNPQPDTLHPFRTQFVEGSMARGIAGRSSQAHVGRDVQDLLVALALVLALREPEPGAGDPGEALAPTDQVAVADVGSGQ